MILKIYKILLPILSVFAILAYIIFIIYYYNEQLLLPTTGVTITLLAFLTERYEKIIAMRVELQTDFYKQWKELRKDIKKLKENEGEAKSKAIFEEYFHFLNHEFDMRYHLSNDIMKIYSFYRSNEFKDLTKYGGKTHKEWWDKISEDSSFSKKFKKSMEKLIQVNAI
jgi:hypothetical protein